MVTEPKFLTEMAHHDFTDVSGFTFPDEVYLDKDLLPEAKTWLDIVWVWDKTVPRELPGAPFPSVRGDRAAHRVGSPEPARPGRRGGVGDGRGRRSPDVHPHVHAAIYVPGGLPHGPLVYNRVDRPILNIAIGLQAGDYE